MSLRNNSKEEKYFYTIENLTETLCPLNSTNDIDLRKKCGINRITIQGEMLREQFNETLNEGNADIKTMYEKLRSCKQFIKEYKRAINKVYGELKREKKVLDPLVHKQNQDSEHDLEMMKELFGSPSSSHNQ